MNRSSATQAGILLAGGAATTAALAIAVLVIGLVGAGCAQTETPEQSSCDSTATRALVLAAASLCVAGPLFGTVWAFVIRRWLPLGAGCLGGLAAVFALIGMIL